MAGGKKEFTFFWFVENYSYCRHKTREALLSPPFTVDGLEGTAWTLVLNRRREEDKAFISLYLGRFPSDKKVSIKYELSILAADGSALSSRDYDLPIKTKIGLGYNHFLKTDEILLQRNCPQDILTVRCKIWKGHGNVHKVAPICARTRIGVETISFMHVVESFSKLEPNQKNTIKIRSHSQNESFASSSLYFTHDSCRDGEMIVEITPSGSDHILCKRKISLLGSGNIIVCGEDDNRFDAERKDTRKLPLSLTRQAILNKRSEYFPDDKISLLCECSFFIGLEFEKIEDTQYEMPIASAKLKNNQEVSKNDDNIVEKAYAYPSVSEDMKALYVDQCHSDVELRTKTKSFPAHKIVLCARSAVFKRMLTSDMKEKNTDRIQVDDLEDDVVQQLLLFLYSDTVENIEYIATQLYYAADKYQIGKLKEVCSSFLLANLTPTNAGDLLLLADTYSDGDLKKMVEDFILEHEEQVFGSDEWEMLTETSPLLVLKAMHLKYKRKK